MVYFGLFSMCLEPAEGGARFNRYVPDDIRTFERAEIDSQFPPRSNAP